MTSIQNRESNPVSKACSVATEGDYVGVARSSAGSTDTQWSVDEAARRDLDQDSSSVTSSSVTGLPQREPAAISVTGRRHKKPSKRHDDEQPDDEEPLIDTTAALTLHSKKLARQQKKQQRREARKVHSEIQSFLDLPHELLIQILSYLPPSDVYTLLRLNHATNALITSHTSTIGSANLALRYPLLQACFPAPIPLHSVPASAHAALHSQVWQSRLRIHRNPYQHIQAIDPTKTCTCMSCVLAWNNLNIILDLAHFQTHLATRTPIPMIPRGRTPQWNTTLLATHATIVSLAMTSPLAHARILQTHLRTTTSTILRSARPIRPPQSLRHGPPQILLPKPRLYALTDLEAEANTDAFLARKGPETHQPLFHRDNYYSVEAWVPGRKWGREEGRWRYHFADWPRTHEGDVGWLVGRWEDQWRKEEEVARVGARIDGAR
jgi:hypothetical protein